MLDGFRLISSRIHWIRFLVVILLRDELHQVGHPHQVLRGTLRSEREQKRDYLFSRVFFEALKASGFLPVGGPSIRRGFSISTLNVQESRGTATGFIHVAQKGHADFPGIPHRAVVAGRPAVGTGPPPAAIPP